MTKIWTLKENKMKKQNSSYAELILPYINQEEKVAIAVSGGPDSMFLSYQIYHYFLEKKYNPQNIVFIHLNHNVRDESRSEAQQVQERFSGLSLKIFTRPKTSRHTENDLRKRRYQMFLEAMIQEGCEKIFLGHHFDDRVETSFLNLLRGCGIDGFMGIKPKEAHHLLAGKTVIRPLLSITKQEILDFCTTNTIPYVTDLSNSDSSVSKRNYIRHELIPHLFQEPEAKKLFELRYKKYDSESHKDLLIPITISPYRQATSAYCLSIPREEIQIQDILRIYKVLHASSGITRETLEDFLIFIQTGTKGRKYFQGVTLMLAHDKVYFFVAPPRFREKTLDNHNKITTLSSDTRFPQKDDTFRGKTRNKYCITEKIPLFWRNFIPVHAKGNKIISRDKKARKISTFF